MKIEYINLSSPLIPKEDDEGTITMHHIVDLLPGYRSFVWRKLTAGPSKGNFVSETANGEKYLLEMNIPDHRMIYCIANHISKVKNDIMIIVCCEKRIGIIFCNKFAGSQRKARLNA